MAEIHKLFSLMEQKDAHEILLQSEKPPHLKTSDGFLKLSEQALSSENILQLLEEILTPEKKELWKKEKSIVFSYTWLEKNCRFRVSLFQNEKNLVVSLYKYSQKPRDWENLQLPVKWDILKSLDEGLVLITGPSDSGKSQTAHALARKFSEEKNLHVLCLENQKDIEEEASKGLWESYELGFKEINSEFFETRLKSHPHIILWDELLHPKDFQLALRAAIKGHLVIACYSQMGAFNSLQHIERNLNENSVFWPSYVRAVISQCLTLPQEGYERRPLAEFFWINKDSREEWERGRAQAVLDNKLENSFGFQTHLKKLKEEGNISEESLQSLSNQWGLILPSESWTPNQPQKLISIPGSLKQEKKITSPIGKSNRNSLFKDEMKKYGKNSDDVEFEEILPTATKQIPKQGSKNKIQAQAKKTKPLSQTLDSVPNLALNLENNLSQNDQAQGASVARDSLSSSPNPEKEMPSQPEPVEEMNIHLKEEAKETPLKPIPSFEEKPTRPPQPEKTEEVKKIPSLSDIVTPPDYQEHKKESAFKKTEISEVPHFDFETPSEPAEEPAKTEQTKPNNVQDLKPQQKDEAQEKSKEEEKKSEEDFRVISNSETGDKIREISSQFLDKLGIKKNTGS